jgi:hypothetical protein
MAEQLFQLRSKKQQPSREPVPQSLPYVVPSTFWIYRMKLKIVGLTFLYAARSKHPWASIQRYLLSVFMPEKERNRLKQRLEGECNRCGHCCRILFDCPFLYQEPGGLSHCTIYMTRHAPKVCVVFPLDPADLAEIKRAIAPNECSFSYAPGSEPRPARRNSFSVQLRRLFQSK